MNVSKLHNTNDFQRCLGESLFLFSVLSPTYFFLPLHIVLCIETGLVAARICARDLRLRARKIVDSTTSPMSCSLRDVSAVGGFEESLIRACIIVFAIAIHLRNLSLVSGPNNFLFVASASLVTSVLFAHFLANPDSMGAIDHRLKGLLYLSTFFSIGLFLWIPYVGHVSIFVTSILLFASLVGSYFATLALPRCPVASTIILVVSVWIMKRLLS
jgi:hypothetical protein